MESKIITPWIPLQVSNPIETVADVNSSIVPMEIYDLAAIKSPLLNEIKFRLNINLDDDRYDGAIKTTYNDVLRSMLLDDLKGLKNNYAEIPAYYLSTGGYHQISTLIVDGIQRIRKIIYYDGEECLEIPYMSSKDANCCSLECDYYSDNQSMNSIIFSDHFINSRIKNPIDSMKAVYKIWYDGFPLDVSRFFSWAKNLVVLAVLRDVYRVIFKDGQNFTLVNSAYEEELFKLKNKVFENEPKKVRKGSLYW